MRVLRFVAVVIASYFALVASAQVALGEWRTHFSYSSPQTVEKVGEKLFVLAEGSLFSYHLNDRQIETFTTLNGLSDNSVTLIRYNSLQQVLVVVYSNSNIDLITRKDIYNLSDIYLKSVVGSKTINDIFFHNHLAYLASECGIIVVNLSKREVKETYDLGRPIKSCAVINGILFAFTSEGVWTGDSSVNLLDRNNWTKQSSLAFERSVLFDQTIVAHSPSSGLYQLDAATNSWLLLNRRTALISLKLSHDELIESTSDRIYRYSSLSRSPAEIGLIGASDALISSNTLWCTTYEKGLCGYSFSQDGALTPLVENVRPQGPASNVLYNGVFNGGTLYFITSGPQYVPEGSKAQVMQLREDQSWFNLSQKRVEEESKQPFLDALSIAVDPTDKEHYYVSTWSYGLFEFRNDSYVNRYHKRNSPIESIYNNECYQWINGLAFDKQNNLWMLNSGVINALKVLKADGSWTSLHVPQLSKVESLDRLLILRHADREHKWVLSRRDNSGILIFDDKETLSDGSDDQALFYTTFTDQDDKLAPATAFNCMVEDRRGSVWVGTNRGPLLFPSPLEAFGSSFRCHRIKVPRNDGSPLADYLLENENVTSIAVDGANRKWMGTADNGLFLFSEESVEIIDHFTAANSPLPSNNILSLTLHPQSGELFIGTDQGLVSYRSDATEPEQELSNVVAFPNPVRPHYTGWITVTGLVEQTEVRIVNSGGQLVFKGEPNGGAISWNGQDSSGQRARSGVYLVFCATPDGKERIATKILIVN